MARTDEQSAIQPISTPSKSIRLSSSVFCEDRGQLGQTNAGRFEFTMKAWQQFTHYKGDGLLMSY
jgi:hypothetical protein